MAILAPLFQRRYRGLGVKNQDASLRCSRDLKIAGRALESAVKEPVNLGNDRLIGL
jgi:hypothetical protein